MKNTRFIGLVFTVCSVAFSNANAKNDYSDLSPKKQTPLGLYADALETNKKLFELGDEALLIDVRTRSEVSFIGMPERADANIPFMVTDFNEWNEKSQTFKLVRNKAFIEHIDTLVAEKGLDKHAPIFLLCRSGKRSANAARKLAQSGYTNIYTVVDGFEGDVAKSGPLKGQRVVNGWKNAGLPWTYKLDPERMYWD